MKQKAVANITGTKMVCFIKTKYIGVKLSLISLLLPSKGSLLFLR